MSLHDTHLQNTCWYVRTSGHRRDTPETSETDDCSLSTAITANERHNLVLIVKEMTEDTVGRYTSYSTVITFR